MAIFLGETSESKAEHLLKESGDDHAAAASAAELDEYHDLLR